MKKAIVVGTGAGGSTVAKELQGKFDVTVLEEGNLFHPLTHKLAVFEKIKRAGLLFDERLIQPIFPAMKITKTIDGMVLVRGKGSGGTTTISAGNAVRMDRDLKAIGINLDTEFSELKEEIPVSASHQKKWRSLTKDIFNICQAMELQPTPTPKMTFSARCTGCGKCVLGCHQGAKWDSRSFLDQAVEKGAETITGCKVQQAVIENGRATGVLAKGGLLPKFYPADLVVLAAGGLGTPVILENSGIKCRSSLFVDPVLCVATRWNDCLQNHELPMPFIVQKEHFIISPYFDFLSFFFNRGWGYPGKDIYSLMIKLADDNSGSVSRKGLRKSLTQQDRRRLEEGINLCKQIFHRLGRRDEDIFLGTVNAGHPGGTMPLTEKEALTLHHDILPENLYVADASLLPNSVGNPLILTIAALAKRISKLCLNFAC